TINGSALIELAMYNGIGEKVNVDTVALPVINEPKAPKHGATNSHTGPQVLAIFLAIYSGILIKSYASIPELIKTCSIASMANSEIPIIFIVDKDVILALPKSLIDFL